MPELLIERIAVLKCEKCNGSPYILFRRRNTQRDGTVLQTWENILWPSESGIYPPSNPRDIRCPNCDHQLRRIEL